MTSLFVKVVRQARLTFDAQNTANLRKNMEILALLVDKIQFEDFHLDLDLVSKRYFNTENKAPCTFVDILETDRLTMSVFIMAENYTMPLHDHPLMNGILKCIRGKIKIQSYSPHRPQDPAEVLDVLYHLRPSHAERKHIICRKEEPKEIDVDSEAVLLSPNSANFHQISAIGGPVAFFDILSPPYSTKIDERPEFSRKCSFFRELCLSNNEQSNSFSNLVTLEKIPAPLSYYCDNILYNLPKSDDFLSL